MAFIPPVAMLVLGVATLVVCANTASLAVKRSLSSTCIAVSLLGPLATWLLLPAGDGTTQIVAAFALMGLTVLIALYLKKSDGRGQTAANWLVPVGFMLGMATGRMFQHPASAAGVLSVALMWIGLTGGRGYFPARASGQAVRQPESDEAAAESGTG